MLRSLGFLLLAATACARKAPPSVSPEADPTRAGAADPDATTAAADGDATGEHDDIDAEIRARLVDVRACYDARVKETPDLQGVIVAVFVIDDGGRARDPSFTSETLKDGELEGCLAGVLGSIEFPAAPAGGEVEVTYPFDFRAESG